MQRTATSTIVLDITEPADLVFSIAAAGVYQLSRERITATLDGAPVSIAELTDVHSTRLHRVESGIGELVMSYEATIEGEAEPMARDDVELLTYLRPSRYSESDELAETSAAEFRGIRGAAELLTAVSSWVGTRLSYMPGSSLPTDGAVRTLLARRGVCRDYSHLCVALLRAQGVPARSVAVYAPGLDPMDFHAVAEAWVDRAWRAVDATTLAPRSTLVRIATGRDAADTAFLNVISGRARLVSTAVAAVADELPNDDLDQLASVL
ncbi:transglutaminase family protein [Microbacterium sp. QXD-8]|uniref:Transglutaminase family protein n=1 Tax=Microbacterium psychrotolerans TaxID=3068321 RepID=A0ABU0Z0M1_9MICO|nr:transglutaminase family protein [Microbacterium sp. QXD-8]MDQ7878119.1 transglutaminase family protein [Microbacterium sp. QXD-8]